MFTPSTYQQRFFNFVAKKTGSCVLIAVAGSGKTTTAVRALPLLPALARVHMLAFNTTIAAELETRIAALRVETDHELSQVQATTFHKVGNGMLWRHMGRKIQKPNGGKLRKICRAWLGEEDFKLYAPFITKLVGYARGEGIGALVPSTDERWYELVAHHDLQLGSEFASEERGLSLAKQLLNRSNQAAKEEGLIDFDDMLYLPLLWRLRFTQNDVVVLDEAQDTNRVRRAFAKSMLKPGGRLFAVGDPKQGIYGFTGASHDAIELIKQEFSACKLPLTVSYRCAKSIVERAQAVVPYIEAAPNAEQGEVSDRTLKDALTYLTAHDAVLCRQTAPLMSLAFKLIAKGTACIVLGREIGQGLVNLIKQQKAAGIDALQAKLEAMWARESAKFIAKGEEQKAEALQDRLDCIHTVIDNLPANARTVPALIAKIEGLFSDQNGCLTLCTVHKAKGKEWNTVAILRPNLMPSRWARQEWQQEQEQNLIYVATTRAKTHLIHLTDEEVG